MINKRVHRGMVFGVFDGLHDGHRAMLRAAETRSQELCIVLTLDSVVRQLKARPPLYSYKEREEELQRFFPQAHIIAGDETLGSWNVLSRFAPDLVFLGYDQEAIAPHLQKLKIPYTYLRAHRPEALKSTLLNKRS